MGITISPPGPESPLAPQASQVVHNTAAAPIAGQICGTLTPTTPGVYKIDIYAEGSGTLSASDQDNVRLQVDSVTISTLPFSAVNTAGVVMPVVTFYARSTGLNVRLQSIAAATATAVYAFLIVITKVGS